MKTHLPTFAAGLALLFAFALAVPPAAAQPGDGPRRGPRPPEGSVLRHVVLVQFKEDAAKEQIRQVEKEFAALKEKIDAIIDFEWGTDVSVEGLAAGFTHCFLVTFRDEKGRDEYLPHPAHKEFAERIGPVLEKVLVVDYFARPAADFTPPAEKPARLLRHVVLFQFKEESSREEVRGIVRAFRELPARIDAIHDFEWGRDVSPEGHADGLTHCFLVTFRDAKGRDEYLPHPAHKEFVDLVGPHLKKVVVVDYWTGK